MFFYKKIIELTIEMEEKSFSILNEMLGANNEIDELKNKIDTALRDAHDKNTIIEYGNDKKIAVFDTGLCLPGYTKKERIFGCMFLNFKTNEKNYYGIFFSRETILRSNIYQKYNKKLHIGDILFDKISDITDFLRVLGEERAIKENWDFSEDKNTGYKSNFRFSILRFYLENIYFQLFAEDKIIHVANDKKMFFNTGLLNRYFKEIIIMCDFVENSTDNLFSVKYTNPRILLEQNDIIKKYFNDDEIPQKAMFYENEQELIFDSNVAKKHGINLSDEHIFEDNKSRIPYKYRDKAIGELINLFKGATAQAVKLTERNYKLATPQYWPNTREIQFLLPIYLSGDCGVPENNTTQEIRLPDCALSVKYMKEWKTPQYKGVTILTLGMAYSNARLIAKPDTFWLEPTRITSENIESEDMSDFDSKTNKKDSNEHINKIVTCEVIEIDTMNKFIKVDIVGLNLKGSIHISEFSNKYISNLENEVQVGQKLRAKIYKIHPKYGCQLSVKQTID